MLHPRACTEKAGSLLVYRLLSAQAWKSHAQMAIGAGHLRSPKRSQESGNFTSRAFSAGSGPIWGGYYEKKCNILSARRMGGSKAPAASGAQDLRLTSAVTIVMAIRA